MHISREELEKRLKSPKNVVNSLDNTTIVPKERRKNSPPTPIQTKIVAGALAVQSSVKETAEVLGLTQSVVRESMHSRNPEVRQGVEEALSRVQELAIEKLMQSLGLMTEERMCDASLKDLSRVAADMSRVIDHTTPKQQVGNNVQFLIYAPQQRKESDYNVVDV